MTDPRFVAHESRRAMAEALATDIGAALTDAVERRGRAGMVVSGGSTPEALFEQLSKSDLPWDRLTVTLADERLVSAGDPASNARLVRRSLLVGPAAAATFIPLAEEARAPEEAAAIAEQCLDGFPWPADITILGMGTDGHTASWFPGAAQLAAALASGGARRCIALWPEPLPEEAPYPRLTLSLPAVLDSRRILVMLAGEAKRTTYERAMAGEDERAMPVRAVLRQRQAPLEVHWAA